MVSRTPYTMLLDTPASWLTNKHNHAVLRSLDVKLRAFEWVHIIEPVLRLSVRKSENRFIQYLVWPPLAFKTAAMRLGILSISLRHFSTGILYHSTLMRSQSSSLPCGSVPYLASCRLKCCQRCS